MGSVPVLTATGDNDPELFPVRYYRHYAYCDACGSFELDPWRVPENAAQIERTRKRLGRAALISVLIAVAAAGLARGFYPSMAVLVLLAGLTVIAGLLIVRGVLGSKIEYLGSRCRRCGSTYAHGTPFFTDLDANPRQLTIADVPRPLGSSLFWRGKSVEAEPPKP
jgi:hypothetical protein